MPRSDILEDSYSNAVSGLVATTLKDAIDEINADTKYVSINSVGTAALATGTDSVAIGSDAAANSARQVALGFSAGTGTGCTAAIVIGDNAGAGNNSISCISVGDGVYVQSANTIGIGTGASIAAGAADAIAIGTSTSNSGDKTVVIGETATANTAADEGVAIGHSADITAIGAIAIGRDTAAAGVNSVALGANAIISGSQTYAVQLAEGTNSNSNTLQYRSVRIANNRLVTPLQLGTETTSTITATVGEIELVNVTSGPITINPPSSPQALDIFAVSDSRGNAATNNITIDFTTATQNLHGSTQNYLIDTNNGYIEFIYVNSTIGWIIK